MQSQNLMPAVEYLCGSPNDLFSIATAACAKGVNIKSYGIDDLRLPLFMNSSLTLPLNECNTQFPGTDGAMRKPAVALQSSNTIEQGQSSQVALDTRQQNLRSVSAENPIEYLCLQVDSLITNSLTPLYHARRSFGQLETLILLTDSPYDNRINMMIHTVCRIKTLKNLSIQFASFDYKKSTMQAILCSLSDVKRIDLSFSGILRETGSSVNKDDLHMLRSRRERVKSPCIPELSYAKRPLMFLGSVGISGLDLKTIRRFLYCKAGLHGRSSKERLQACRAYFNNGIAFNAAHHYMSWTEPGRHHNSDVFRMLIKKFDQPIADVIILSSFYLLKGYLSTFEPDCIQRTVILNKLIHRLHTLGDASDNFHIHYPSNYFYVMKLCLGDAYSSRKKFPIDCSSLLHLLELIEMSMKSTERSADIFTLAGMQFLGSAAEISPEIAHDLSQPCIKASVFRLFRLSRLDILYLANMLWILESVCAKVDSNEFISDESLQREIAKYASDSECDDQLSHCNKMNALHTMACLVADSSHETSKHSPFGMQTSKLLAEADPQHFQCTRRQLRKFLSSRQPAAIHFALRDIRNQLNAENEQEKKLAAFNLHFEGIMLLIHSVVEDLDANSDEKSWAAEIIQTVDHYMNAMEQPYR